MTYEAKISNIIVRLKEVKVNQPSLTLQKIADHTGVSLSTVTRIFAEGSEECSFRYESIRPIAEMLLDLDNLDGGADDEKALKAIIQFKDTAIEQLKAQIEDERDKHQEKLDLESARHLASIEFLKHQIELKDERITQLLNNLEAAHDHYDSLHQQYLDAVSRLLRKSDGQS
jgi:AraC-like DNA-binding protein